MGSGGARPGAGRKRKPAELAKLEGSHKKQVEPVLVGGRQLDQPPEPPANLPPAGKELWNAVVVKLYEAGFADTCDWPALKVLCVQWARAEMAGEVIAQEGYFALGSTGQLVEHPALSIERQAHALLARFMAEFPLTAASRARAGIAALTGAHLQAGLEQYLPENPRRD